MVADVALAVATVTSSDLPQVTRGAAWGGSAGVAADRTGWGQGRRSGAAARAAAATSRRQASRAAGVHPRIGRAGLPVRGWPA
ncbi:MAG: hypothetical protein JO284_04325 [Planctomycetaceae bacterium]|nr:hypothetical protein [Planctomycetaceae bacterium]MBV8314730.1 hypothetical protein [Planctomycetaceae bacterium]